MEKCNDCGCELTKASELVEKLCWMCGPGSLRFQEKNPSYVHGVTDLHPENQPVVVEDTGPRFCRISGLPLTKASELEMDMHYLHGPGSTNWQEKNPRYTHSAGEYAALVAEYQKEKRLKAALVSEGQAEQAAAAVKPEAKPKSKKKGKKAASPTA